MNMNIQYEIRENKYGKGMYVMEDVKKIHVYGLIN